MLLLVRCASLGFIFITTSHSSAAHFKIWVEMCASKSHFVRNSVRPDVNQLRGRRSWGASSMPNGAFTLEDNSATRSSHTLFGDTLFLFTNNWGGGLAHTNLPPPPKRNPRQYRRQSAKNPKNMRNIPHNLRVIPENHRVISKNTR